MLLPGGICPTKIPCVPGWFQTLMQVYGKPAGYESQLFFIIISCKIL